MLAPFFMWGVSLTPPVLASFLCGEFLLYIQCCLLFYLGNFSYTSRAGSIFYGGSFSYTSHDCFVLLWEVSLTLPMLASFSCGEFFLHIPYWRYFYLGTFSSHPCLLFFFSFCGEFLLHIPYWLYFIFIWGLSLTHPMLASLSLSSSSSSSFVFCFCFFNVGSFSYPSRADFIFMRGDSLTHPVLISFFTRGVSLTHPALALFLSGTSLTHP